MLQQKRKPFPTAPNKLRNYVFKHLTQDYQNLDIDTFLQRYDTYIDEFAKRVKDQNQVKQMEERIEEFIFEHEIKEYERMLATKEWTIQQVESDIRIGLDYDSFFSEQVGYRVFLYLEEWNRKYGEAEKEWTGFSKDSQNVHTSVISNQMNDSLRILLSIPIPPKQKTLDEIASAFLQYIPVGSNFKEVYKDMKEWGNVKEIFQTNDYLYRRTLRGLWAKIQTYSEELKKEVIKRLWEECLEATGLCATGHISRLTNVLVGFDENFQPQISIQEMFQNAMANIQAMNISTEEKIEKAKKIMDEMNIPSTERQDWLDAL